MSTKKSKIEIVPFVFAARSANRPKSPPRRGKRFGADTDSFGGRTTYVTIEFKHANPVLLFDFSKSDLREIVERISATAPTVIDPSIRAHLDKQERKSWKTSLRPGDGFIFTVGAIFVLLAILWSLL